MKFLQFGLAGMLAVGLVACREKTAEPVSTVTDSSNTLTAAGSTNLQTFLVRGVIKKLEPEQKSVTIQHEAVPNYMPAMTMPFKVKEPKELEGLQTGETVWFRLSVTPDESWIDKIKKERTPAEAAPQAAAPEREPFRIARDVEPLNVGDAMPDYRFTNQLGRTVQLSDFKGQALAFTFIFTRCPLPDFCPRMSRNFTEVQQKLKSLPNGPTNWHLLTISFDPHFDTPTVLRNYAQVFQYDPARWDFVTGAMIDIDAITDQFNLAIMKRGNEWDHKVRTVVIDVNGRVQKIIIGNDWKPDALVEEIVKAAKVRKWPPRSLRRRRTSPHSPPPRGTSRIIGRPLRHTRASAAAWNNGTATYDLRGVRFTEGVEFDFSASSISSLEPGQFALVVDGTFACRCRSSAGPGARTGPSAARWQQGIPGTSRPRPGTSFMEFPSSAPVQSDFNRKN